MATITEDYVSFETAKLLKEKGFNEETEYIYSNNGELLRLNHFGIKDLTNTDCNGYHTWQFPIEGVASIISAPTLQTACKWLREVHHWHISVIPKWEDVEYMPGEWEEKMVGYQYVIMDVGEVTRKNGHLTTTALSPESACEAGIKYCLEHLIK